MGTFQTLNQSKSHLQTTHNGYKSRDQVKVWDISLNNPLWTDFYSILCPFFKLSCYYYYFLPLSCSVQFSSITQLCLTLWDPMDCSMPGLSVHHQLLESTQTHVQWVGDAIRPSHPLLSPSPPAFNLSQHQGLSKWISSSHQVAKVLEFQHQSFQWTFRNVLL